MIAALLREAFAEFRHLYTDGGFAATVLQVEQIQQRMREGPVWVAVREGKIVGTASAVVKGETLYIRGVAVPPSARGAGIGYEMMLEAERFARRQGCNRLFLTTTPFLDKAIYLYERSGFRRSAEAVELFGTPLFAMEKLLSD